MENNIKIISKYSLIKEFNSPEEFDKYYLKHKEEINNKTSNQLNKEYKIKDYKITKRNIKIIDNKKVGDIYLKPIGAKGATCYAGGSKGANENIDNNNNLININNEIQEMKNKINLLTESYNEILNILKNYLN